MYVNHPLLGGKRVVSLRGQKLSLVGQIGANVVLRGPVRPRITSKCRNVGRVTCFLSSSEIHDVHDTRDNVHVSEEEFVRVASKVVSNRESAVSNSSYVSSPVTDKGVAKGSPVEESTPHSKPIPRNVENPADDPRLENPLKRMERMGTGWMGVIFELEGVCVEYEKKDIVAQAWSETAKLEHKEPPKKWQLDRALGMKNEQAVQEVFCWTRIPQEAKRIGGVKEEILSDLLADSAPVAPQSALRLLKSLESLDTPRALVSSAPEKRVRKILELSGMDGLFDVIVSGEDVYRGKPDPEGYLYAAQQLDRPPFRCVLVGNNNSSIEAAHEVGMQCVVVAGSSPLYEVSAADLAVKSLDDLSFINLKKLFGTEMSNVQFDLEEETI